MSLWTALRRVLGLTATPKATPIPRAPQPPRRGEVAQRQVAAVHYAETWAPSPSFGELAARAAHPAGRSRPAPTPTEKRTPRSSVVVAPGYARIGREDPYDFVPGFGVGHPLIPSGYDAPTEAIDYSDHTGG